MSDADYLAAIKTRIMSGESINGWSPPVVSGDYKHTARVVTQADVDRWLEIERKYFVICHMMAREIVPHLELPKEGA